MPSVSTKYKRYGLRVQWIGPDRWFLRRIRAGLEQGVLERGATLDVQACHEIAAATEFSGAVHRIGLLLKRAGLSVAEQANLEQMRLYALQKRVEAVRRLLARRSNREPDQAPGDALAAILAAGMDDLALAPSPSSGSAPGDLGGREA